MPSPTRAAFESDARYQVRLTAWRLDKVEERLDKMSLAPDRRMGEWRSISTAPRSGVPILVWDDYYLMRIARWDSRTVCEIKGQSLLADAQGQWVQDLPYGDDPGRGEIEKPLTPRLWMRLPITPKEPRS